MALSATSSSSLPPLPGTPPSQPATPQIPSTLPNRPIYKKLDCYRVSSNVFMLAAVISLIASAVLTALVSAGYLHPMYPLFPIGGFFLLLIPTIVLDCCLDSTAKAHRVDRANYIRSRQPMPPEPKKKSKKSP